MEDAVTTEPGTTETGQPVDGSGGDQTTAMAPAGGEGQSVEPGTTGSGPQPEDTFFDPKTVPEHLQPAYKQMQAAFTKKMQNISSQREKVQAYDAFMQDPVGQLRQMAQQYGFQVTPQGQQTQGEQSQADPDWQPQNWNEVIQKAAEQGKSMARQELMQELKPVISQFQQMKATATEKQLDDIDPTWRQYEEDMMQNLQQYPNLALDIPKLYKLSVPDSVIMSRATQEALRKLEAKTKAGGASGGSTTTKQPADDLQGQGPRSFQDSIAAARKKLAEMGMTPPKQ
jgi:hypothetical protein